MKGEAGAKQLSAAEKPTGKADEAGDERLSEVENVLGSKTQKMFLDLWADGEGKNKGVQLQKEQIIYFTFDAYGTEQKPKPPAKYFLKLLILDILQHSHPHRACLTMGEIRWIM